MKRLTLPYEESTYCLIPIKGSFKDATTINGKELDCGGQVVALVPMVQVQIRLKSTILIA